MQALARLGLALVMAGAAITALQTSDTLPAEGGDIVTTPIYHASVQIAHGGTTIQVDPWGQGDYAAAQPADLILLTDNHPDHLDPEAIGRLRKPGAPVVGPAVVAEEVPGTIVMANGETRTVAGVPITAVPMYNIARDPAAGPVFHTKGRGNGYVIALGGKRIYIAGDTACTPEVRQMKDIDLVFLPMNLPYTMSPMEAADCAKAFKPRVVYPYHYRGQDLEAFAAALKDEPIEVRLRDWYRVPAGREEAP